MLQMKNVTVSFGKHTVLKNLSCHIEAGDFIVVVGTNGAGKTTFFDTIAGRIVPQSGAIVLDGIDVTHLHEAQRATSVTRIFQDTKLNSVGSLTVAQNLALAHYSRRNATLRNGMDCLPLERAQALVQKVGLPNHVLDKQMSSLSGGQRQLLAFTMATQHIPKILLLDEPTAALDPQAATRLLQYAGSFIKEHALTTIMITHDPYIALTMGNKIWILDQGRITHQYDAQQKKDLDPSQLIGHIDYASLAHY